MKAHSAITAADRDRGKEDCRVEVQGRLPKGPFENFTSLAFAELQPSDSDKVMVKRAKAALLRDARWSSAGSVFVRLRGYDSAIRTIYSGGVQLVTGGGS